MKCLAKSLASSNGENVSFYCYILDTMSKTAHLVPERESWSLGGITVLLYDCVGE